MIVLKKRALSSPDALLCSLRRRLAHLSGAADPVMMTALLPFEAGETTEEDHLQPAVLAAAGLGDAGDELAALHASDRAGDVCDADLGRSTARSNASSREQLKPPSSSQSTGTRCRSSRRACRR